jgi:hypothetical protein
LLCLEGVIAFTRKMSNRYATITATISLVISFAAARGA